MKKYYLIIILLLYVTGCSAQVGFDPSKIKWSGDKKRLLGQKINIKKFCGYRALAGLYYDDFLERLEVRIAVFPNERIGKAVNKVKDCFTRNYGKEVTGRIRQEPLEWHVKKYRIVFSSNTTKEILFITYTLRKTKEEILKSIERKRLEQFRKKQKKKKK